MPPAYKFSKYTIGYTPWESTEVPDTWVAGLKAVDELWTPAEWITEVFGQWRQGPISVIPHGMDEFWTPVKRERGEPFTFLHVGEPAVRKGGDIVLAAWHKAFARRKDVQLIIKCVKYPTCRVKDRSGSIIASPESINNIRVLTNVMTQQEMYGLYLQSHCMVYPSRGEGFGLIPFEAMGTGLPTITPNQGMGDFVLYNDLKLTNTKWVPSTEDRIHPGNWMTHDVDELIGLMEQAVDNYGVISEDAFNRARLFHDLYSWNRISSDVERRLKRIDLDEA